jgi:hypothetical protein
MEVGGGDRILGGSVNLYMYVKVKLVYYAHTKKNLISHVIHFSVQI